MNFGLWARTLECLAERLLSTCSKEFFEGIFHHILEFERKTFEHLAINFGQGSQSRILRVQGNIWGRKFLTTWGTFHRYGISSKTLINFKRNLINRVVKSALYACRRIFWGTFFWQKHTSFIIFWNLSEKHSTKTAGKVVKTAFYVSRRKFEEEEEGFVTEEIVLFFVMLAFWAKNIRTVEKNFSKGLS